MNLGVVLTDLGQLDEAEVRIRRHFGFSPTGRWPSTTWGRPTIRQGKPAEALACYEEALGTRPTTPRHTRTGRWPGSPAATSTAAGPSTNGAGGAGAVPLTGFARPRWQGDDLAGRTILLHAEQGLGDTLQFVRYAPLVKQRGGHVLLVCPRPLVRLLLRLPGHRPGAGRGAPAPFDVQAPLVSLPMILGTTLGTVPAEVPYLAAAPAATERWRQALGPIAGFRIGIAWQGNRRYRSDRQHSFSLAALGPLARVGGVRLINLQKGAGPNSSARSPENSPSTCLTAGSRRRSAISRTPRRS